MMRTFLPATLGLIAILGLSFYEGFVIKDRWAEPGVEAEELSERFKEVPTKIGDWVGQDKPVDEVVRKTAGAIGYVSRVYTNTKTNKNVVLWLIVGHSRDITRHTPNICYPSQGFRQTSTQQQEIVELNNGAEAAFYTAKFEKEDAFSRSTDRVFWTFNHPDKNKWEAPEKGARWHYGLAKALYKLYFTSQVLADEETIGDNVAAEFAELMLPEIDAALFPTESTDSTEGSDSPETTSETDATETDTEVGTKN